jgi:hypothetical protein
VERWNGGTEPNVILISDEGSAFLNAVANWQILRFAQDDHTLRMTMVRVSPFHRQEATVFDDVVSIVRN